MIHQIKITLRFNKPAHGGMCILELSKNSIMVISKKNTAANKD